MQLKGERILLRMLADSDISALMAICNDPDLHHFTRIPYPYTRRDAAWFIDHAKKEKRTGRELHCGIIFENKLIGMIGIHNLVVKDKRTEIGYFIAKVYRGKGFATEAVYTFLDFLFASSECNRIEIVCSVKNLPSQKVIENVGAEFEGIARERCIANGIAHDVRQYSILRKEYLKKRKS